MAVSRSKYHAKKTAIDGITFDSRKEAGRYRELKLLERAGEISELELQKRYELIPALYETYERYGKRGQRLQDGRRCVQKAVVYVADFCYKDKWGNEIVEDAKGVRTKEYVIKRKLMRYIHGIDIKEV